MKQIVNRLLLAVSTLLLAVPAIAADYTAGKHYMVMETPQPTTTGDKIEVVELFFYGCPTCFRFEPLIESWHKDLPDDVEFVRMPAILGKGWDLLAKAYFTAELLGAHDKIHAPLFDSIHKDRRKYVTEQQLREFFVAQGVDGKDFDKTFNSFAVNVKVNNARLMTRRYKINGVPTMIVNGKYSTSGSMAGGNERLLQVVDQLVEQERKQAAAGESGKPAAVNL